jgi:hypothetical protein
MSYHDDALKIIIAYAATLQKAAERELRGGDPVPREEAAAQLRAALRALDAYNPEFATKRSTEVYR